MLVELFSQIDPFTLVVAAGWIFLGAAIRGYSGFGSAAIAVAGLSLLLNPDRVIPLILMDTNMVFMLKGGLKRRALVNTVTNYRS